MHAKRWGTLGVGCAVIMGGLAGCGAEELNCPLVAYFHGLTVQIFNAEARTYRIELESDVGAGACVMRNEPQTGQSLDEACESDSPDFGLSLRGAGVRVDVGRRVKLPRELTVRVRGGAEASAELLWAETVQPVYIDGSHGKPCGGPVDATIEVRLPSAGAAEPLVFRGGALRSSK